VRRADAALADSPQRAKIDPLLEADDHHDRDAAIARVDDRRRDRANAGEELLVVR